jgi:hypothetical protein
MPTKMISLGIHPPILVAPSHVNSHCSNQLRKLAANERLFWQAALCSCALDLAGLSSGQIRSGKAMATSLRDDLSYGWKAGLTPQSDPQIDQQ